MCKARNIRVFLLISVIPAFLFCSCNHSQKKTRLSLDLSPEGHQVPSFPADSAWQDVATQVRFGPRTPGSHAHQEELQWITDKMDRYAGSSMVYLQKFEVIGYHNDTLHLTNIIAAFSPRQHDRIMVSTHWDTRPRADQDPDSSYRDKPIPGADDGASGVAVLLELARIFHQQAPPVGVDLVFWDGEDYGRSGDEKYYFLGSRYWAKHPPVAGYHPRFGILLDMVGGKNAHFPKEGESYSDAPFLVNAIWKVAGEIGLDTLFTDETTPGVTDDHTVLNRLTNFPTIDIIDHRVEGGQTTFPSYWHTHRDNLSIIDKNTMKAVGHLMLELIYNRL